jgi:hypothetical protein
MKVNIQKETTRRDFGKGALWVAPALTVLLTGKSLSASPVNGYTCQTVD